MGHIQTLLLFDIMLMVSLTVHLTQMASLRQILKILAMEQGPWLYKKMEKFWRPGTQVTGPVKVNLEWYDIIQTARSTIALAKQVK